MSKQTVKGGIYYDTDSHAEMCWGTRYKFFPGKLENFSTYIAVCAHIITFDLPEAFDPRPIEIAALEKKATELQAETTAKLTAINRRISELQALTYETEAA